MRENDETKNSIKRIQNFDVNTLERKEDLGTSFAFSEALLNEDA